MEPEIIQSATSEDVKRAVKEALDDKKMTDIAQQLANLSTQMADGFAKVHQRQDITNGKVVKHEEGFLKVESRFTEVKSKDRYDKLIWALVTTLIGVVVYFLTKG